jgi:hypothetical protein
MFRIPTLLAFLLASNALTWAAALREASRPVEAVPANVTASLLPVAHTAPPCVWSNTRRPFPWRTEQPFHLVQIERATEQEEESFDPILGPVPLLRSLLDLDGFDREARGVSSRPFLSQPRTCLLPILRC